MRFLQTDMRVDVISSRIYLWLKLNDGKIIPSRTLHIFWSRFTFAKYMYDDPMKGGCQGGQGTKDFLA